MICLNPQILAAIFPCQHSPNSAYVTAASSVYLAQESPQSTFSQGWPREARQDLQSLLILIPREESKRERSPSEEKTKAVALPEFLMAPKRVEKRLLGSGDGTGKPLITFKMQ